VKSLTYEDLELEIRESARRRTLELIVDRDGSLVLATPPDVPVEVLERFVREKSEWIYLRLAEKESKAQPKVPREYVTGEGFPYLGRSYRLRIVDNEAHTPPLRLYRGRFELRENAILQAPEHFANWYTIHLRPILDREIAALAERVGAQPREVHVQDLGYRWGSSSKRGHLYFHWRVAMLPRAMIAYLVAHELVHLVERRHSDAFWSRVEQVIPDYAERVQWLREYGGMYDL